MSLLGLGHWIPTHSTDTRVISTVVTSGDQWSVVSYDDQSNESI